MSLTRKKLDQYLKSYMNLYDFEDYCPNGLQVEGREEINRICYAVSATRESIEQAVALRADALIVHHGLFWKFHGVRPITKAFAARIKPLIQNDINLFGLHLPLDAHLECGNAVSIANLLEMQEINPFGDYKGSPTGVSGQFKKKMKANELKAKLETILGHNVLLSSPNPNAFIESMGIITGGANSDWILAKRAGLDAYLSGEMSEHDWHEAKESDIHFFAGGHNATEQFGIQELMKKIDEKFASSKLEHFFIPSENPA